MLGASNHWHPVVPTSTQTLSRSADRSETINTLGFMGTAPTPPTAGVEQGPVPVLMSQSFRNGFSMSKCNWLAATDNPFNSVIRIRVKY